MTKINIDIVANVNGAKYSIGFIKFLTDRPDLIWSFKMEKAARGLVDMHNTWHSAISAHFHWMRENGRPKSIPYTPPLSKIDRLYNFHFGAFAEHNIQSHPAWTGNKKADLVWEFDLGQYAGRSLNTYILVSNTRQSIVDFNPDWNPREVFVYDGHYPFVGFFAGSFSGE